MKVGSSWYAPIRPRGSGAELYGTYRYMPTWWVAWIGAGVLILLAPVVGVLGGVNSSGVWIAGLAGVLAAVFLWAAAGRPRLVVHQDGVTVVGSLRVRSLAWREIERFDCQQCLIVITTAGKWIPVGGLPAPGLRRVLKGVGGPVDALADRLNGELAGGHDEATRELISIATEEGRRDIRLLAVLTTIGTLVTGIARIHFF